jgi:hypothetical protein
MLLLLIVGLGFACSSGRGSDPEAAPSPASRASLPSPDEYGSIAPTPAADEATERIILVAEGVRNCGHFPESAGYPTTIAPSFNFADCLIDSYRTGDRSQAAVSARDNTGGQLVAVFAVHRAGLLEISAYHVGPDGNMADRLDSSCSPPVRDVWLLGANGSVSDDGWGSLCG